MSTESCKPCDICFDNTSNFICLNCKVKYCYDCLRTLIVGKPDSEAFCSNCQTLLPLKVVKECMGLEYFEQLAEAKIKVQEQPREISVWHSVFTVFKCRL